MRKFFPQDKNVILQGAQLDLRENLIPFITENSKQYYNQMYNPLGLIDDTITKVNNHSGIDSEAFIEFYDLISAIYRYKYGSNQLEFLFDGMDHYTKYTREWRVCFIKWLYELFGYEPFLKTVLQITVFEAKGHSRTLAINRLRQYLIQHFDLKFYKYKGLQKVA